MNKFRAKLTAEQRQKIVERFDAGEEREALAKEYGVHPRTVDKIIFGGQHRYKGLQRAGVRQRPARKGYSAGTFQVQAAGAGRPAPNLPATPVPTDVPLQRVECPSQKQ